MITTLVIYDKNGNKVAEKAIYKYIPILLWRDVIIGASIGTLIFSLLVV